MQESTGRHHLYADIPSEAARSTPCLNRGVHVAAAAQNARVL